MLEKMTRKCQGPSGTGARLGAGVVVLRGGGELFKGLDTEMLLGAMAKEGPAVKENSLIKARRQNPNWGLRLDSSR